MRGQTEMIPQTQHRSLECNSSDHLMNTHTLYDHRQQSFSKGVRFIQTPTVQSVVLPRPWAAVVPAQAHMPAAEQAPGNSVPVVHIVLVAAG